MVQDTVLRSPSSLGRRLGSAALAAAVVLLAGLGVAFGGAAGMASLILGATAAAVVLLGLTWNRRVARRVWDLEVAV